MPSNKSDSNISVFTIVSKVVVIVAIAEFLIMCLFLLPPFNHLNDYFIPILDTFLLTLIISPILFKLIIKPFVLIIEKRDQQLEVERHNKSYFDSVGAIESLTAGLVHEIGNPVAVIGGMVDEIIHKHNNLPEDIITSLQCIQSYNHKLQLINKDLAKIAAPTSKEYKLVDFNEDIVNKVIKVLHYDERWYGADLKIKLSNQLPAFYCCDGELKLLLSNLLNNCIEAQLVNNLAIEVSTEVIADEMVLSVKDNGIGMDEKTLQQAFSVFFTTKDPLIHQGFGLYCCLTIIEQNKGRINITSKVNEGTEVKIYFPITH